MAEVEDRVEVLHRNRFWTIPGASARRIGTNVWEVSIPSDAPVHRKVRRQPTAQGWDGAVFLIGDDETEPGVGSGEGKGSIRVTVVIL